ncbi:MAG TPA: glycosyltransferase [Thermoanaerobaculia bacterium]|nr:glycosyltransferase [Thermoanaerobaculia bacterium]
MTVLMAVFNGGAYLREAIDSILAQTFTDYEFLIVDDGSTDDTPSVLRSYRDARIRVLTNERNLGLTASLNRGLRDARGEWIARQDADDRSHPERLQRQLAFVAAHDRLVVAGTQARIIDARGRAAGISRKPRTPTGIAWCSVFHNPLLHSSVIFRRDAILEAGGYDEAYPFNQDFELWSRLMERHAIANLDEVLIDYRAHGASIAGRRDSAVLASRIENVARNKRIQHRNVLRETGSPELADEWPELWTAMNVPWLTNEPSDPRRALELVARLWEAFRRMHAEAEVTGELRSITASSLLVIALYLTRRDRTAAARALWRAYRDDRAQTARALPRWVFQFAGGGQA